ncbi:hypothetical protein E1A91_D09G093600v1 [Gossypium mustelinum]|uniref:C2H2-type domain-containing protein n=3 Tax=Gossypium TaxID=3633 RepID=A0A5D2TH75_GOSMU|nr:hypothetical protein E1A91_D09G093600v1 [Gossypium mustelinum]
MAIYDFSKRGLLWTRLLESCFNKKRDHSSTSQNFSYSFLVATMNFLLPRDDSEEHAGTKTCFYCNKVFSSHRALGGHLRIHQDGSILRALNYPGGSSSSVNNTGNPPASLPNSQLNSFASFNSLSAITSNSVNNSGNPPASLPNSQPNSSSSFNSPTQFSTSSVNNSGNSPASLPNNQLNSTAFNSLTLLPAAHLACDFSWMIYLNETNQISQVTLSPSFGNALPNVQAQNAGPPSAGSANVGRSERRSSGKRSREADRSRNAETSNASRRPRIAPNEHVEPENCPKKELQLFVDVVVPSSSSEASSSAEEEDLVDMDLSLHL